MSKKRSKHFCESLFDNQGCRFCRLSASERARHRRSRPRAAAQPGLSRTTSTARVLCALCQEGSDASQNGNK
eukprot:342914-Amphidinium_carterae.1